MPSMKTSVFQGFRQGFPLRFTQPLLLYPSFYTTLLQILPTVMPCLTITMAEFPGAIQAFHCI